MTILELLASIPSIGSLKRADTLIRELAARGYGVLLIKELDAYRESVRVDVQMDGPRFGGCNISQLRRAWELTRVQHSEALIPAAPEGHIGVLAEYPPDDP